MWHCKKYESDKYWFIYRRGKEDKEKKMNVTQIAYSVGFSSQTYFSTTFKQYYGVSPLEYIRQIEEEEGKNTD